MAVQCRLKTGQSVPPSCFGETRLWILLRPKSIQQGLGDQVTPFPGAEQPAGTYVQGQPHSRAVRGGWSLEELQPDVTASGSYHPYCQTGHVSSQPCSDLELPGRRLCPPLSHVPGDAPVNYS